MDKRFEHRERRMLAKVDHGPPARVLAAVGESSSDTLEIRERADTPKLRMLAHSAKPSPILRTNCSAASRSSGAPFKAVVKMLSPLSWAIGLDSQLSAFSRFYM
nr:hypothetical protein [Pseudomonas aeruginosa]